MRCVSSGKVPAYCSLSRLAPYGDTDRQKVTDAMNTQRTYNALQQQKLRNAQAAMRIAMEALNRGDVKHARDYLARAIALSAHAELEQKAVAA